MHFRLKVPVVMQIEQAFLDDWAFFFCFKQKPAYEILRSDWSSDVCSSDLLDLAPGEALGVIGRSGSGKTTLARVVTGIVRPAAGEVRLAGATLDQYGSERLGQYLGYLPQEIRLFDGTVAENIAHMETSPDPKKA